MYYLGFSTLCIKFECLESFQTTKIAYLRKACTLSRRVLGDSSQLCPTVYCNECAHLGAHIVSSNFFNFAFVAIIESQYSFRHLLLFL